MTLEGITENNLNYALQVQKELFSRKSVRTNYEECATRDEKSDRYTQCEAYSCNPL